jgi:predicted NACHT family NTPase
LEQGKCILLLDGLDEISETPQRIYVAESVNALASRYPSNRFVITIRPVSFSKQVQLIKFDYYKLLPWSEVQVQAFINRWATLSSDPAAREQAEPLLAAIRSRGELRALASNPLLLTLIAQLYRHQSAMPIARSELYKQAVNMLLDRWDMVRGINRGDIDRFYLDTLSAVALKMCERQVVEIDETEVVRTLAKLRGTPSNETATIQSILKTGGGLLVEEESGKYRFVARSLQEYFAARALVNSPHPIQATLEHKEDPYWREVILFVIDFLMQGNSVKGNELLQSLLDTSNTYSVILVGQYLTENSATKADANFIKHVHDALRQMESDDTLEPAIRETSKIIKGEINRFLETA